MPSPTYVKSTTRFLRVATLLASITAAHFVVATSALAESSETMRIRIAWGGATGVQWAGRVSVGTGRLTELSLLGREHDTPGSLWLDNSVAFVAQPRPRTFDGFDITVNAPLSATLKIEMRAAGDESSTVVEKSLAELMNEPHRSSMPSLQNPAGTTLLVHRLKDDSLRIHTDREDLVFTPGETFRFDVEPVIAGLEAGGSIDLVAELVQGRSGPQEWTRTERVALPVHGNASVELQVPLPMRDGVYSVKLSARTPPGNNARFWKATTGQQVASRTFQIVVLGEQASTSYLNATWKTQIEIDPSNPGWWNRLPDWTRLDRLANITSQPLASEPFRTSTHRGQPLAELSPGGNVAPSWRAYPLPGAEPGRPHVVEVDLPTDVPQKLIVRVYEPNSSDKLIPTGPGGGVLVDAATGTEPGVQTYRYLFWPRTRSPMAVIQNGSGTDFAKYGKIRLRIARPTTTAAPSIDNQTRMVAAYFDWPSLLERTTSRLPTRDGRPPVDDWQTFYNAAERLAVMLEVSGYNAAVVNVLDGGSAAFDLGEHPNLPVLNTTQIGGGTTDLPAAEPLELLLRFLSRRGLQLIPTLRFTATLPGVEAGIRRNDYRTLEEFPVWTNLQRQPRRVVRTDFRGAQPPHYRLAHADVAAEIRGIARRLIQRSSTHPAFAGIGLELTSESHLALPPAEYGITQARLAQLARLIGADATKLDGWVRQPRSILDHAATRRAWLELRARQNTRVVEAISADVRSTDPQASVLLLTPRLLDTREFDVRPRLTGNRDLDDLYLERGLDMSSLRNTPNVLMSSTRHVTRGLTLADAAQAMQLSVGAAGDSARSAACVCWQHATDVASPVAAEFAADHTVWPIVFDAIGELGNSRLTPQLFDGASGAIVVGGPAGPGSLANEACRRQLRLASRIPAVAASASSEAFAQPVSAHVYPLQSGCVTAVVNDFPWPVTATVTLDVAERTAGRVLASDSQSDSPPASYEAGSHAWKVQLAPHETQALKFETDSVKVTGVNVQVSEAATSGLGALCDALERQDLKPDTLAPYSEVLNTAFEQINESGTAVGWESPAGVATVTPGVDGNRAAQLVSAGDGAYIATQPFRAPPTGQMALTGYVRVVRLSADAELRLFMEEVGGTLRPPHVTLPATTLLEHHRAKQWNAYQFGVDNLALDSQAMMRIRIELIGEGEVWIDQLQVHDLLYPLNIYPEESDQQVLALVQHVKAPRQALEARQYRDCQRLLDSYWSRFVLEYLPAIEQPSPGSGNAGLVNDSEEKSEPTPRITDRVRDWLRF